VVIPRVSLYRVSAAQGRLRTTVGEDFDAAEYSRFKYGDAGVAECYAAELTRMLEESGHLARSGTSPLVITTAPFKFLATASFELAKQIQRRLNVPPSGSGRDRVEMVPLHMRYVDAGNYSAHSHDDRCRIQKEAGLHVGHGDIRGRQVLLVDDAVVSGAAEARAVKVLTGAGGASVVGAYVVEVDRISGRRQPEIEDELNHAFVRDLDSLLEIFRGRRLVLNIRTVKYVLSWPDHEEVQAFLDKIGDAQLFAFGHAVSETGDSFARNYPDTVSRLLSTIQRRSLH
jgi:hypothetical protein